MAGITTRPFRAESHSPMGSGLAWTEMISAEGPRQGDSQDPGLSCPGEMRAGRWRSSSSGTGPEVLRDAALIVEEGPGAIIDINMGCPVRKIVKGGSGAALMREPAKVGRSSKRSAVPCAKPVTIKIRSGWDERSLNAAEIAKIAARLRSRRRDRSRTDCPSGLFGKGGLGKIVVADVVPANQRAARCRQRRPEEPGGRGKGPSERRDCAAVMIGRAASGTSLDLSGCMADSEGRACLRGRSPRDRGDGRTDAPSPGAEHRGVRTEERRGCLMRRPLAWYSRGLSRGGRFSAAHQRGWETPERGATRRYGCSRSSAGAAR